ncbi:MAG: Glycosyltransferase involved in cell wall bisynthesis [Verrucomicrobia bacterium]|nr:MAG: Glycosyltransferase involved in cell wall bisynthesis [Verrucomicrobiota bacterium]
MHETAFSFSNLESPTPGDALPPGRHMLRGWVMPKPGGVIVDVRARVGGRVFPGVHGIPRADLAAHFQTGRPVALAEFYVVVDLLPGPAAIVLEALELEGRWSVFQKVHYFVTSAQPPVHVAMPTGPLRWHEYGRALQILLRAQRREPAKPLADLARAVADAIPYPRDLRHPHLPFHGHLDEPAALTRCGFGRSAVLGYLFHETQPIKRVLATFDLQAWQTIEHTLPSPGPGAHFPSFANAKNCGLFGIIDVPAQLPDPVSLRLYAELADGSLHLCPVQRSLFFTNEDEKAPYPPHSTARFATTHAALQAALQERGVEVVFDAEMEAELARLTADFAARAPQTLPAVPPLQPAPLASTAPAPRRVLLVSHNLNLEGAPLFLVDYARHLASLGSQLTVLSPADGPLRARFEELGAKVQLTDAAAIFAAPSTAAAHTAIHALAAAVDFAAADLVVCNTFTTFWAVHAAKAAGRRVLLYVHESTTPASFYLGRVHAAVIALVDEAFGLADCVSFTTASTRSYHLDYGRPANHRLTPGWIDVARIDAWRAAHPREDLRTGFRLKPGELLVTNVGTVCDRKGQHIFARAVDLLWRRQPELAARTRFVMLGGGDTPFDRVLADLLAQLNRPNLIVHPSTPDYFPYYAAADLFVCSTYEESSPRVILEAMACGTPILSSGVQGVLEQVRADREATLIPPGDTVALGEGMAKLLLAPATGRTLAARARTRVTAEFDAAILLPRHAALASAVAAGQI